MKTINKAVKTTHSDNQTWQKEFYEVLHNYRATRHSSTGRAPAEVLFGQNIRTKLPEFGGKQDDSEIREADSLSKRKMKEKAEQTRHFQNHELQIGDDVLFRAQRKINSVHITTQNHILQPKTTYYDPKPYKVKSIKGSMITATRDGRDITRNCSFFKQVLKQGNQDSEFESDDDNCNITQNHNQADIRGYPLRHR